MAESDSRNENTNEQLKPVRLFSGAKLLGQTRLVMGDSIFDDAELASVTNRTNNTSGKCVTCLVTPLTGTITLPEILPSGVDNYTVDEGGRLGCISKPTTECDIDINPPL